VDLKELELGKRRGVLVSLDNLEREITDLVLTTMATILAIPARVSPELVLFGNGLDGWG
jgi:hypothetical protein